MVSIVELEKRVIKNPKQAKPEEKGGKPDKRRFSGLPPFPFSFLMPARSFLLQPW